MRFAQVGKLALAAPTLAAKATTRQGWGTLFLGYGSGLRAEFHAVHLVASVFGEMHMDTISSAGLGARRNEDIALDLMKFVAGTAGVGKTAVPSTGFTGAGGAKPEEHVNQLLALYSRCLKAVEGKGPEKEAAK